MPGISVTFYIKEEQQWIIKKAMEYCKKHKFRFKNREYKTRADIINLGLEMVRQYFKIKSPLTYKELINLDEFLDD